MVAVIQKAAGQVVCPGHGPQKVPLAAFQNPWACPGGSGEDFCAGDQTKKQSCADEKSKQFFSIQRNLSRKKHFSAILP
jgi:hypothetical protein